MDYEHVDLYQLRSLAYSSTHVRKFLKLTSLLVQTAYTETRRVTTVYAGSRLVPTADTRTILVHTAYIQGLD